MNEIVWMSGHAYFYQQHVQVSQVCEQMQQVVCIIAHAS